MTPERAVEVLENWEWMTCKNAGKDVVVCFDANLKDVEGALEMAAFALREQEKLARNLHDVASNQQVTEPLQPNGYSDSEPSLATKNQVTSNWISVEERMPEPNTLVLVVFKRHDEIRRRGFGILQTHGVWYVSNEGMPPVTHWMPLPETPKE